MLHCLHSNFNLTCYLRVVAFVQGIVYFGSDVLGWRPVVKAWLSDKNQRESQCLHKYFEQTVDSIAEFVLQKSG